MQDATTDTSPQEAPGDVPVSPRGTLAGRWHALNRRWGRLPITLMIASLLLGLGIVQLSFQIGNSIYRSVTWSQDTRATLGRVHGLESDVHILQDAQKMASDPAYLEQLARCQGFVGGKEKVVVASNAPTNPGSSCDVVRLP